MTTTLFFLCSISVLGHLFAVIFIIGARQAAKEGVVDTMRINGLIEHRFTVIADATTSDWGVLHRGGVVSQGPDLRAALDEADNKVADHG